MLQEVIEPGTKVSIPVGTLEFYVEGNTIWIQSLSGGTTLRIKTTGKIVIDQCKNSPLSHSDIIVKENINFCISSDAEI